MNASNDFVPHAYLVRVRQEAERKLEEKSHEIETMKKSLAEKAAQWTKEKDELNAKIAKLERTLTMRKTRDDEEYFGFEHLNVRDISF